MVTLGCEKVLELFPGLLKAKLNPSRIKFSILSQSPKSESSVGVLIRSPQSVSSVGVFSQSLQSELPGQSIRLLGVALFD